MSTVSSIVAQVRALASKPFVSGDKSRPKVAECITFIRTKDGYTLFVECSVNRRRYLESVRGNLRNVEETVAQALRVRHNIQRRGKTIKRAPRAAAPCTQAPPQLAPNVAQLRPTYIGDYDKPKSNIKASIGAEIGRLQSDDIAKLLTMAMTFVAGLIIGYVIWGTL